MRGPYSGVALTPVCLGRPSKRGSHLKRFPLPDVATFSSRASLLLLTENAGRKRLGSVDQRAAPGQGGNYSELLISTTSIRPVRDGGTSDIHGWLILYRKLGTT